MVERKPYSAFVEDPGMASYFLFVDGAFHHIRLRTREPGGKGSVSRKVGQGLIVNLPVCSRILLEEGNIKLCNKCRLVGSFADESIIVFEVAALLLHNAI